MPLKWLGTGDERSPTQSALPSHGLGPKHELADGVFERMGERLRNVLRQINPGCPESETKISGNCSGRDVVGRTCALVCRTIEDIQTLERLMHARERFVATLEELENRIFTEESDPRIRNFRLIDESLAILKERVQLDYAGILLLKGSEKIVIHENGRLTPSDSREETLNRQIRQAVRHTEEPGRYAYLCPSESSKGWVDAIIVFRNVDGEPVGCLLLDDHDEKRRIGDDEVTEIVEVFYDRLHAIIREEEIRFAKQEIETIRQELQELRQALEHSHFDPLTGLLRKEFWMEFFEHDLERLKRSKGGSVLSAVIFDIDHFKRVNDTMGHIVWDRVLGKVGEIFRKGYVLDGVKHRLRKTDVACRWGGEEFVCLLEETDAEGAFVFAERIRRAVSELVIEDLNGASFGIKMSAGIMEMRTKRFLELGLGGNAGVEYVFDHADQALYRAKASGRNQTVVWTEEGSAPESADVLGKADETGVKRNPLPGRKDDALSEEVRAMLEQGEPPERYSERKDKKEGARAFLARVYGRYLEKGDERIYLHEIRRLDPRFANSLQLACLRAGEPVWLSVPKRSDLTDRTLAAVGEEKATEITKAARALERRKPRASARSRKA